MNILFLGSSGPLSLIPLKFLQESSHKLCAVGIETTSELSLNEFKYPIIASKNETVEMFARMAGIPAIHLLDSAVEVFRAIKACAPDIILVSCLNIKLPEDILSIPSLGCFNLHPSLLPAFRGPVPLFWQFREGVEDFGMTLHRVNASFDSGPIIAQNRLSMPDGIGNRQATEILARVGSDLLDKTLDKIARGEIAELTQNEVESSYMSIPTDSDFKVSTTWTAKRMYNFICATEHWGKTYTCEVAGHDYSLIETLSYRATNSAEEIVSINQDIIHIPCVDGVVTAKIAQ